MAKIFKKPATVIFLIILGLAIGSSLRFLNDFFYRSISSHSLANVSPLINVELAKKELNSELTKKEPPEINLVFVGDIMLDRGVRQKIEKVGNNDFRFPFLKIAPFLNQSDLVAGNLEGPLSDKGKKVGNFYSFRMSPQSLDGLTFTNFKVLFLANNHSGDWGEEALKDTVLNLRNVGILPVGADIDLEKAYSPKILEIKGVKFAFLAFSDFFVPGVALAKEEKIKSAIKKAQSLADLVIVAFHFGTEYLKEPNARQKLLAQLAIDNGADLVIGSHPHVIEPLETYHQRYIAYSLGNFVFDQKFSKDTMTGGLLKVILKGKRISQATLYEVRLNNDFQPELENEND